jgi:hypothetical protein
MPKQTSNLIPIENFNLGGLAHSKWSGIKHSLYKLIGWDLHSTPGILKVAQKLVAETTGAEPTEFCKAKVNSSNGAQYWGSSTSGKIWERPSGGTWRLVHTVTPAAGEAKILGLVEYQSYIYVFTESRIHRILVSEADDNDWATDLTEDWATFGVTDSDFHPHIEQSLVLYIGDGNQLAQIDGTTFSANALDIKTPLRIKSLGKIGTDVLLGTYVADTVTKTEIIRWNTYSVSFTTSDTIPEVGINAFLPADNFVIVQAGNQGNLYYYDGEKLEEYLKIPGDYSPTAYGEVYPTAVGNLGGKILFGFSNDLGNPADQGIYQIARSTRDHPYVLDMPYPISQRSAGALVLSSVEIGGILVVGTDVYASWKKETTVTITIASPGVVTYTGHSLTNGDAISFTTTGALPTGLTAETIYFARSTGDNTLNIYDTAAHAIAGGATGRINTSGTQSGVHTASNFGIDKLDYSNKLEVAYFETRVMVVNREQFTTFKEFVVAYADLPEDTAITIQYEKNYAAEFAETTEKTDSDKNIVFAEEGVDATTLRLKVLPTVSGNDAPQIESAGVFLS